MRLKNCYYPKNYDFITTDYGYDIYDKKIKDILEQNEYQSKRIYIHMIIRYPNSTEHDEVVESMILAKEWHDGTYEYEWDSDWCEGQTDVCIMGIYTDNFIDDLCIRYSHKNRYSGGWFTI